MDNVVRGAIMGEMINKEEEEKQHGPGPVPHRRNGRQVPIVWNDFYCTVKPYERKERGRRCSPKHHNKKRDIKKGK